MKKLSILALSAIAIINLASCKKDRVCECTTNNSTTKYTVNDATKRQAKANCVSYSYDNNGTTVKTTCELKK
jgi:hypothetical protein